jgi:hypothetical protein
MQYVEKYNEPFFQDARQMERKLLGIFIAGNAFGRVGHRFPFWLIQVEFS